MGPGKKAFVRAYVLFALGFLTSACAFVYRALGDDMFALAFSLTAVVCVAAVMMHPGESQKVR